MEMICNCMFLSYWSTQSLGTFLMMNATKVSFMIHFNKHTVMKQNTNKKGQVHEEYSQLIVKYISNKFK